MNNHGHQRRRWRRWERWLKYMGRFGGPARGPHVNMSAGLTRYAEQRMASDRRRAERQVAEMFAVMGSLTGLTRDELTGGGR